MAMSNQKGGGYGSRQHVEKPIRTGTGSRSTNPGGVGQIGRNKARTSPVTAIATIAVRVLHRWPKARPLHAVIAETLANVELLLAHLESGVRVADSQRALVRDLFVATQRQREVLTAALRLEELE